MNSHGEYCLPGKAFSPEELDFFLKANTQLETIWLYSNPGFESICSRYGFHLGAARPPFATLDLTQSLDALWQDLDPKRRNGIRFAMKSGVVISRASLDDAADFKPIWINGYCAKYGFETESADESIRSWIESGRLFLARLGASGPILAGTVVTESKFRPAKDVLIYSQNTSLKEFQKYKPNELLLWEITKWAKQEGYNEFCLAGGNLFKVQFTKRLIQVTEWTKNPSYETAEKSIQKNPQIVKFSFTLSGGFQREVKNCWTISLSEIQSEFEFVRTSMADDSSFPRRSPIRVYEDDVELGPGHSAHEEIVNQGEGAFSHWRGVLYFSSLDNTDPNTNGRTYSIAYHREAAAKVPAHQIALSKPFWRKQGNCWVAELEGVREELHLVTAVLTDDESGPFRSPIRVFEDSVELDRPHSLHERIRTLGGGAFSHWKGALYLSTSDNSDPNQNGRVYRLECSSRRLDTLENKVSREVLQFLKEEYAAKGDELYQWYRLRFLPNNTGLSPWDIEIANFVALHCRRFKSLIEIGAGIGQAAMLLAAKEFPVIAVEASTVHCSQMAVLAERVERRVAPHLRQYFSAKHAFFPDGAAEYLDADTLLCFIDLSWGLTSEQESEIMKTLPLAGGLVMGLRYFFKPRDADQQEELIEEIVRLGFKPPIDIFRSTSTSWEGGFPPNRIVFFEKLT